MRKPLLVIISILVLFQIYLNVSLLLNNVYGNILDRYSKKYPGSDFIPLKKHLINIDRVGFWSDVALDTKDINTKFMSLMQGAQFALAPTILDHYNPFNYEYLIIYSEKLTYKDIFNTFNAKFMVTINEKVFLVKRKLNS